MFSVEQVVDFLAVSFSLTAAVKIHEGLSDDKHTDKINTLCSSLPDDCITVTPTAQVS
jgi:hypothetical protein